MKKRVIVKARFIPRAQTLAEWEIENPVLLAGEHGVVTDGKGIKKEKIGDGVTPWNKLEWWGGASAYDVAVAQGFEGTEKEWLISLNGKNGDVGPQGEKGDKGDAFTYDDLTDEQKAELKEGIEQCFADQSYNPDSENAQSGTAVAEAVKYKMPKIVNNQVPFSTVPVVVGNPGVEIDEDGNFYPTDDSYRAIVLDDGLYPKEGTSEMPNAIVTRDSRGNLWTGEPVDAEDCVNKQYVDETYVALRLNDDVNAPLIYAEPYHLCGDRDDGYMLHIDDGGALAGNFKEFSGRVARRYKNGNLLSGTPTTKHEVANKMYVDALVGGIETALIDQTYDPQSENAQSGKAMADILATLDNKIESTSHSLIFTQKNLDENHYTKTEIDTIVGDIETALDELHNYAQALINGGTE